jgi:16S rRNA (cytidine1402-2'-O)-methyltransferase
LSSKESQVRKELEYLKDSEYAVVFYEAPHRILKTLRLMLEIFGDRYISISREISKLHESVFVGMLSDVLKNTDEFKGEFVIVVSPSEEKVVNDMSIVDNINMYIRTGLTSMEAIKKVAKERKIPKNEVYKEFHGGDNK